MSGILLEKAVDNRQIGPSIYRMTIESEFVSQNALPGQFVNIKCGDGVNALLRRPISICTADRKAGTFDIVYQVKGKGTELLAKVRKGETVDLLGPLGKPFEVGGKYRSIAVVGGGIGIFPLLFLLQKSGAAVKKAFLGFRSKEFIVLRDEFEEAAQLEISTDDGSNGYHGLVTDLLQAGAEKGDIDIIYACGPTPMLKNAALLAEKHSIPCQVSMEQRMGCGIGACLVCACKTREEAGEGWAYSHVCKDGPVFWSSEVIFDE